MDRDIGLKKDIRSVTVNTFAAANSNREGFVVVVVNVLTHEVVSE